MSPAQEFARLVQAFFLEHLLDQRDLSPRTVAAYRDAFKLFLGFLERSRGRAPEQVCFADLDSEALLAFCRYLETERGNCARTVNCRLAAMRCFLRYAAARLGPEAIAQVQRVSAIPFKRFTRPLLGFLSKSEIGAVLQACDDSRTGRRDRLLLQFLYNTGARVSEACSTVVEDVRSHDLKAVLLRGKGRKQRVVPLWKETTKLIRRWIMDFAPGDADPLMPNRFGRRMTRAGVQQRLQQRVKLAIPSCPSLARRRVCPHMIRHTTAMHLLQAGVATPVIALWLGHENVNTTHQYIEADLSMKEEALKRLPGQACANLRFKPAPELMRFLDGL